MSIPAYIPTKEHNAKVRDYIRAHGCTAWIDSAGNLFAVSESTQNGKLEQQTVSFGNTPSFVGARNWLGY